MKIIIFMVGCGFCLCLYIFIIFKFLLLVSGKFIVQCIVEDLAEVLDELVEEVVFVIGDFGVEVEVQLQEIVVKVGVKCFIYIQDIFYGLGYVILCVKLSLSGNCIVVFVDMFFKANFFFDYKEDGIIWCQKVEDFFLFGVVKIDENNVIMEFVEKLFIFVFDLVIVGLYYVWDGECFCDIFQYMVDNDIWDKGEFQIIMALELFKNNGVKFCLVQIEEWLDCGNKDNVVVINCCMLQFKQDKEKLVVDSVMLDNVVIILFCFIGENIVICNSVVGLYVFLGYNLMVE